MLDTSGRLDLHSFICHLLSLDTSRTSDLLLRISEEIRHSYPPMLDFVMMTLPGMVETAQDLNILGQMPNEVIEAGLPELFHERMHYWQVLGYPIFQMRFLYLLERLRGKLEDKRAEAEAVVGLTAGPNAFEQKSIEVVWERVGHQLNTDDSFVENRSNHKIPGGNFQLEFGIVGDQAGTETSYAGMCIKHANIRDSIRVPFDAFHLVECAVSISEVLQGQKEIPELTDCRTKSDFLYWGCWFYWEQLHSEETSDKQTLMLIFLAAIDITLTSDCACIHDAESLNDYEYYFKQISISDRFARISAIPIPESFTSQVASNPSQALIAYQIAISETLGLLTPTEVSGRQMLRLTRILAAFLRRSKNTDPSEGNLAAERILPLSTSQWREALPECRIIWQEISNRIQFNDLDFIGYRTLAMMLNYTVSRLVHPDEHILSHMYVYNLLSRFQLPLVNFGGFYFKDIPVRLEDIYLNHPILISASEVGADCIQLSTLVPLVLKDNEDGCGLIDELTEQPNCFYTTMGFGCPHSSQILQDEELAMRQRYDLHDFCHWTFLRIKVDIADESTRKYWLSRWERTRWASDEQSVEDNYKSTINSIYFQHFSTVGKNTSLQYICQQSGKVYDEIYKLNCEIGYWKVLDGYDHTLVFYIAGWIKDNLSNSSTDYLSQSDLAQEITDQTLAYLNAQCQNPNVPWETLFWN